MIIRCCDTCQEPVKKGEAYYSIVTVMESGTNTYVNDVCYKCAPEVLGLDYLATFLEQRHRRIEVTKSVVY